MRDLSRLQRDVLIQAAEAGRIVVREPHLSKTVWALVKRGYLRTEGPRLGHVSITAAGRRALAKELADWADAIIRVGASQALSDPLKISP